MTLPPKHFQPSEFKHAILHSTWQKTPDYNLITAKIAFQLPKITLLLLTYIYNSMLRLSYDHNILWKCSVIIMMPEPNKPPNYLESYRPINLIPLLSNIFGKLILKRIIPVIEANSPNIFKFYHNHFTIHQVHRFVDSISYPLEKIFICADPFFDISWTFIRYWYKGLLFKLNTLFPSYFYLMLKYYTGDKHFIIHSESSMSDISLTWATVPKGGVKNIRPINYISLYTIKVKINLNS